MDKTRCDIYLSADIYFKLLGKRKELSLKTLSQTIEKVLREYFMQGAQHESVIANFHKTIGAYEERIKNLQHEIEHNKIRKKGVVIKE